MTENLRRHAVRGVFWSGVQQASDRGLRMLVFSILALLVEPSEIGLVALAMVFIELFGVLLNQGLTAALVQREDLTESHRSSALVANLLTGTLLVGVLALAAEPLSRAFGNPELAPLFRWLSIGFLFQAFAMVQDATLRRELRFDALALRTLVSRLAGAAVGIAMAMLGYGVWSLVIMHLVNEAVSAVVLWWTSNWRPVARPTWTSYRDLLDFGLRMIGIQALNVTRNRGADLLVGVLLGEAALGFYSLAKTLVGGVFALLDGALGPVVWSTLTRLQKQKAKLGKALEESAQLTAAIVFPAGAGLLLIAPTLVEMIYQERWLPSVPVIYGLVVCRLITTLVGHNRSGMSAIGRVDVNLMLSGAAALVTLAAVAIGARTSLEAVMVGLVAATALMTPIELGVSFSLLPARPGPFFRGMASPILLTLVMSATVWVLGRNLDRGWLALVLQIGAGVAVYAAAMVFTAPQLVERVRSNFRLGLEGSSGPREDSPEDRSASFYR